MLLLCGGPSTILLTVRSVVVDAIKRMSWWARSHVFQERSEIVAPPVVHYDPSCAVPLILRDVGIKAASLRALPTFVLASAVMSVALIEPDRAMLGLQTTATLSPSAPQFLTFLLRHAPAVALAERKRVRQFLKNHESSESLSDVHSKRRQCHPVIIRLIDGP